MDKHFDPQTIEAKWYQWWEQTGRFRGNSADGGEPYCVVIPPPNVTGILHMGHALNDTIQDVLVRWRRMQGRNVLWVPGTDHAGIATQNVVERSLKNEGLSRRDLGRERFVERVWEWRKQYGDTIVKQLRRLGASCDWEHERFTMDEGLSAAVAEVFCRLYDEGLIYRGNYIVNWCTRCGTALADDESEHVPNDGSLWYFKYPVKGSKDFLVVATTRPETLPGDTAVAVNPSDERYKHLHGKTVVLPLSKRELPIVTDNYVETEFGTGAVKITPAHDANDFMVAQRHNLPMLSVMNEDGTMNEESGYYGLDRFECRKRIVKDLEAEGYLVKVEPYKNSVGRCYRCNTVIESRLSKQWFMRMKPLAEPAVEAVRTGQIKFTPKRYENTYFTWMENIRDWCISRQIWWGHRIPVYTCTKCEHEWAAPQKPAHCPTCQSTEFTQDEDVLDTWFSSWLWPFSTLGWPDRESPDLKFYYPTSDLVTAPDIIFFWVARMIMAGCKFMDAPPFKNVVFHGIVRDAQGRKMSKSLGNSIDPMDIIERYSADALRFSLMQITAPGVDLNVNAEKFEIGRNFGTKIWNAARFMKTHAEKVPTLDWRKIAHEGCAFKPELLRDDDRHLMASCQRAIDAVGQGLERYRFQDAALAIYDFVWSNFCDWYVEYAKADLYGDDDARRYQTLAIMAEVFAKALKLLHPFMPFLTEEIWHQLGYANDDESIMTAPWPAAYTPEENDAYKLTEEIRTYIENKHELVSAGRALRADCNISPSEPIDYIIHTKDNVTNQLLMRDIESLKNALRAESIQIETDFSNMEMPIVNCTLGTIGIPLDGVVDVDAEKKRIRAELDKLKGFLKTVEGKLANSIFIAKAPETIVKQQQERRAELIAEINRQRELLATFGGKDV